MPFTTLDSKIIPMDKIGHFHFFNIDGVTTNGVFDILHLGHLKLLHEARAKGDFLWVGINSDASVKAFKGQSRPINDELTRARQLASLDCVNYVTIFNESTPNEWLRKINPTVHVKGGDYVKEELPEYQVVKNIMIVPTLEGYSTTNLINKIVDSYKDNK